MIFKYSQKFIYISIIIIFIFLIFINYYNYYNYNNYNNYNNKFEHFYDNDNTLHETVTEEQISKLTKKDCELVISRYNEDISWSKPYKHIRTIYNKGDDNLDSEYQPIIKLENVGTEINTILEHIVRNYDNLANNTIFMQGNISDRYCKDTIPFETFFHSRDNDLIGCKYKMESDLYKNTYESRMYNHNNKKLEPSPHNLGEFYEKVLGIRYTNDNDVIYQSKFSVGKKRILRYSKQYYLNILNNTTLSKHRFPEEGHYMERAWATLFS